MNEGIKEWMPYALAMPRGQLFQVQHKHIKPYSRFCGPVRATPRLAAGGFLCGAVIHSSGMRQIPRSGPSHTVTEALKSKPKV